MHWTQPSPTQDRRIFTWDVGYAIPSLVSLLFFLNGDSISWGLVSLSSCAATVFSIVVMDRRF